MPVNLILSALLPVTMKLVVVLESHSTLGAIVLEIWLVYCHMPL